MSKAIFSTTGSKVTFAGTDYYPTDVTFDETADKVEVTDVGTSGDGREYIYTRKTREFSADIFYDPTVADIVLATKSPMTLRFENALIVGSGSMEAINKVGSVDDGMKITYKGVFEGAVSTSLAT